MKKCVEYSNNFGKIEMKLKNYLDRHEITRNSLSVATGIRYDVIDRYYKGAVTRVDLETLAKICYALECELSDIINYKIS